MQPSPNAVLEHVHHSNKIPRAHLQLIPISTLSPRRTLVCFLCPWVYLFWTVHKNGITEYVIFVSGFLHNTLETHPCCSIYRHSFSNSIPLYGYILHFVYVFISRWTFRFKMPCWGKETWNANLAQCCSRPHEEMSYPFKSPFYYPGNELRG